jgi:osmoprotectant transport system substrate-binding protein
VVRKHTRRAAKAAYAVSLAVAIVIGLTTAAAGSAAGKPTVTIGTKNFTEQYVLGELYKQALQAKGYRVVDKSNIGSSEVIDTALKSGKINFYPEYTGVIVTDLAKEPFPKSASATR